jgi:D-arabinose 1-dehydrogenase-like Zn-dependent alcohol dehydrogenase
VVTAAPDPAARETALALGAEVVLDPAEGELGERLRERLGDGADRVFVPAVADATVAEAVGLLRAGGRAVLVAEAAEDRASVAVEPLIAGELDLVGARGADAQDVAELFDIAADDRLVLSATIADEATIDDPDQLARALVDRTAGGRLAVSL